jgi:hypothetical protein
VTLGNMRANGVRTLAAWCLGRGLHNEGGAGSWATGKTHRLSPALSSL